MIELRGKRPSFVLNTPALALIGLALGTFFLVVFSLSNIEFSCSMVYLSAFLVTFLIFVIRWILHNILSSSILQAIVSVNSDRVRVGEVVQMRWELSNSAQKFRSLSIYLEGWEEAIDTSKRDTSHHKRKSESVSIKVCDIETTSNISSRSCEIRIPKDTIPSFASKHNKFFWLIRMHGDTKWFPVEQEFEGLMILPPSDSEAASFDRFATIGTDNPTSLIKTQSNRTRFQPGEEIRGTVSWQLNKPDDTVQLHLLWHTEGKGDRDGKIVKSLSFANPRLVETREFRFQLPVDVPPSFSGKLISLVWALDLVVKPSKATIGDWIPLKSSVKRDVLEIIVSPTGEELTP